MRLPDIDKPINPRFSCGPTKKPDGWNLKKINNKYLGRYHRSSDVKNFIENQLFRIRKILKIPNEYKIFLMPGSCTGAMEAVIWNLLGKRKITSLISSELGQMSRRKTGLPCSSTPNLSDVISLVILPSIA